MSKWRPPDWKRFDEKYGDLSSTVYNPMSIQTPLNIPDAYEAGADAMYEPAYQKGRRDEREALRKGGVHIDNPSPGRKAGTINFKKRITGTNVFIPDEKESDND